MGCDLRCPSPVDWGFNSHDLLQSNLFLPKSTMAAIPVAIEHQTPETERDNNCHLDCPAKIWFSSTNSDFA
ncbi:hypothetical protein L1987_20983 [Smallanthus sonchifolius]|uniref:Uncharacterized protein n=1 Tax=Smallanthus sonchifolius TaxID=185202 RepID=A0ACB9ITK2_9ASTR|nr:hypothetical protein L1987_20983 [Smallanthus sonchifolius]